MFSFKLSRTCFRVALRSMRVSSEWVRRGRGGGKSLEGRLEGWLVGWLDTFLLFILAAHAMAPTLGETNPFFTTPENL